MSKLSNTDLPPDVTEADLFIDTWEALSTHIYSTAKHKGWWDKPEAATFLSAHIKESVGNKNVAQQLLSAVDSLAIRNEGEMLCLVHSEISECLEGLRHGNPPSEKIPEFSSAEEELADVVIRIMDLCTSKGWDLPRAIISKVAYNDGRTYKHGGKRF